MSGLQKVLLAAALPPVLMVIPPSLQALTTEAIHSLEVEVRAAMCRKFSEQGDVLSWGQAAMPSIFNKPFCRPLHGHLVESRGAAFTSTKAPRGHAKTTIGCALIPLYQAFAEGGKDFGFYLNVQATEEKALAINRAIKEEIETNEVLHRLYGRFRSERWTDAEFVLTNRVVFKAAGAGTSIRGMMYQARRPDYVIVDDLYNEEDIYNPESTKKKNTWLKGTLYSARARTSRTCLHVRGTAINKHDILTEMEKWPGCVSKTFKAVTEDGKPLWSPVFTLKDLEADRVRMGTVIYNREMMNECQDDAEAIIKSHWLTNWEYDPAIKWASLPHDARIVDVLMGCDPSTGEKETGDPAGFATVVKTAGPGTRTDYWIEALENKVMSFDERLGQLERMHSQHNSKYDTRFTVKHVKVETIAGFKDFGNQAKVRTNLPVELISFVKGKKANLAAKSGHFEGGRVHLSKDIPADLKEVLVSQLIGNGPDHDDLRDAVLLCLDENKLPMRSWV